MTTAHLSSPTATPPPPAPLPALEPLEMLYVTNGSLLTAEGWWQSHRYYQHRQNLHYQSLHQPGIVSGLGVRVVAAPDSVPSELRDRRWIEIQPGIAIDLVGNPLVVEEPMTFRITSEVIQQGSESTTPHPSSSTSNGALMVYVVLAYVDPTAKQWQTQPTAVVKEEFRINERTTPPEAHEVELCRIHLTSNIEPLENAADVFNPAPQTLDLRYRHRVQPRAYHSVQVGVFSASPTSHPSQPPASPSEQHSQPSASLPQRWSALLHSIPGLYPPLAAIPTIQSIDLGKAEGRRQKAEGGTPQHPNASTPQPKSKIVRLSAHDDVQNPKSKIQNPLTLLVMDYEEAIALTNSELEELQAYLVQGCTVVIEYDDQDVLKYLNSLKTVQIDITNALADLQTLPTDTSANSELHRIRQELQDELSACQVTFQHQIQTIGQRLHRWAQVLPDLTFAPSPQSTAVLTQHPYLFDELPQLPTGPVHLLTDNGIILVIGSLSAAWTRQQFDAPLPRSTLRDAQELGINILHYASSRQQMIHSQHPNAITS